MAVAENDPTQPVLEFMHDLMCGRLDALGPTELETTLRERIATAPSFLARVATADCTELARRHVEVASQPPIDETAKQQWTDAGATFVEIWNNIP